MTNEERDIITRFVERVGGAPQAGGFAGSVPGTAPALPPIDPEADTLIRDLFTRYPEAPYRLTQLGFVQEHALAEAQNRLKRMEWELEQTRQQAQAQARPSRGLFGGLFGGGGGPSQPPPQQPQYQQPPPQYQPPPQPQQQFAPGYQAGMFPRQGSGFLGSALTTAAGVAGGMLAANALTDLFSGHHGGGFGGGFGGGGFGGETVIEQSSPWAAGGAGPDQIAGGGAAGNDWDNAQNQPDWDSAANQPDQADPGGGGWDDSSSAPDQGFDSSGDGGGFDNT